MPWKASSVMEEKLRFVFEYESDERSMTELCQRYEITRETGYVWLRRYRPARAGGVGEHNRAAHPPPNQTPEGMEKMGLEPPQGPMGGGPRKPKRGPGRDAPGRAGPAASTP